jgi:hypothetical protein
LQERSRRYDNPSPILNMWHSRLIKQRGQARLL